VGGWDFATYSDSIAIAALVSFALIATATPSLGCSRSLFGVREVATLSLSHSVRLVGVVAMSPPGLLPWFYPSPSL